MSRPFTLVYALSSAPAGRYPSMAIVSRECARRLHPDLPAVLLCDAPMHQAMQTGGSPLLQHFERVVSTPIPTLPRPRDRGLYLKTKLREVIAGDLLFVDVDTVPVRPFAAVPPGDWDVAAVQDRNHHSPIDPVFPVWRRGDYEKLGWPCPLPAYFNTGVMFVRDNARTRGLADAWQRHWQKNWEVRGDSDDQFPFNSALFACPDVRHHELPMPYNAMVLVHPAHARAALIYHFFAGNHAQLETTTLLEHLIGHHERTGAVDWATVDRCAAMDHPWLPPYWPRRLWQTGNRLLAVRHGLRNLFVGRSRT